MSQPDLTHVATYRRTVGASLERVWENVLDWEHLPWLHNGSFRGIERIDSGAWGWRVHLDLPPEGSGQRISLELLVDRELSRYVARTTDGVGTGTEIWTSVTPSGDAKTDIAVEFHLPGVSPAQADALGASYTKLYTRLWDEDEDMMVWRSEQLASPDAGKAATRIDLGTPEEVAARAPFVVEARGRSFRVLQQGDRWVAHATVCPHWLGPLGDATVDGDRVVCPWHGYRFDLGSGRCDGHGLRLRVVEASLDPTSGHLVLEP